MGIRSRNFLMIESFTFQVENLYSSLLIIDVEKVRVYAKKQQYKPMS